MELLVVPVLLLTGVALVILGVKGNVTLKMGRFVVGDIWEDSRGRQESPSAVHPWIRMLIVVTGLVVVLGTLSYVYVRA
jgi:hypothetical protein